MPEPLQAVTVEGRLAALEIEVATLKTKLAQLTKPNGSWLEQVSGSMKDVPEEVWQEFTECCKEVREADRAAADEP